MNLISDLLKSMERGSAGSEKTAETVLSMCESGGQFSPKSALFVGDESYTPSLIKSRFPCTLTAAFAEEERAADAASKGLNAAVVQLFELPKIGGGFDFVWYNGTVEFDSISRRLSELKNIAAKGATVVYRTLCWLIEPSPDTKMFCERRFGVIHPLDKVLIEAKEQGFKICDFFIAPKTDWTDNYYKLLISSAKEYAGAHQDSGAVSLGMNELTKETEMFEMHCEEYSYVYYILKG